MYNVKLRGGLLAGKFTDIGKVRSIKTCIRYCCQTQKKCDLAFLLKDRCYLVKCYNEERCQALPSPSIDFNFEQKMAFVAPWLYKQNKKLGMYFKCGYKNKTRSKLLSAKCFPFDSRNNLCRLFTSASCQKVSLIYNPGLT